MNQNDYIGKTLKPWPILVDHYSLSVAIEVLYRQILSAKSADLFIGFIVFMTVSIPQCLRVLRISTLLVALRHKMV